MSKGSLIITALVVLVGAGAAMGLRSGWFGDSTEEATRGVLVRRGPLRISVLENGNLKAAKSVELINELEGSSTILYLIPEGTRVEPGTLLCELDTTDLRERSVTQQISVQNAESQSVKSRQLLEIQKSQNQSDIAAAERKLEFAEKDLKKYLEGDWPQLEQKANDDILLAEEELKRAEDTLNWSEQLEQNGFLTRTEYEADKLAKQRSDIKLAQSKRSLELLQDYDKPREEQRLKADVEEAVREKARVELQAAARLVDLEADLRAADAKLSLEQEKLRKYTDQLAKASIVSPVEGMVVYAKEDGGRFGRGDPIAEGTQVRERQKLITIPSSDKMLIEAAVHESVLAQVQEGQDVVVRVDSVPDRSFHGVVKYKALLPDQNQWWANPNLRVYRTDIDVLDKDPGMRPGMSCSIEVVVADITDAVHVPVQAIFLDAGKPIAFVVTDGKPLPRQVELGRYNDIWVEIKSGLEEGETVLLSQPTGYQLQSALVEVEEDPEGMPSMDAGPRAGAPRGGGAMPQDARGNSGAGSPGAGGSEGRGRPKEGAGGDSAGQPSGAQVGSSGAPKGRTGR